MGSEGGFYAVWCWVSGVKGYWGEIGWKGRHDFFQWHYGLRNWSRTVGYCEKRLDFRMEREKAGMQEREREAMNVDKHQEH